VETFRFPLIVHLEKVMQIYVTLLSININDNRSNQNNYESMKAIVDSFRFPSHILTKLEFVDK